MNSVDSVLKSGKRESAFHVEYDEVDTEKIGVQSPNNDAFYAYVWDFDQNKCVAKLIKTKDLKF